MIEAWSEKHIEFEDVKLMVKVMAKLSSNLAYVRKKFQEKHDNKQEKGGSLEQMGQQCHKKISFILKIVYNKKLKIKRGC